MPSNVKPMPEDYHSLTPVLKVRGAAQAVEFYKTAFHAREFMRRTGPAGRIIHAELRLGDSVFMVAEASAEAGGQPAAAVGLYLYVADAAAAFDRARSAGAKVKKPLADMYWGDRCGQLLDPFGQVWTVAERREELTPQQLQERADRHFSQPVQR
ncbi:MAG: VOC family protein [Elusimicrobia bacterium]|nr:VOC family protein [Elusimicrobiota bacterium]